MGRKLLCLSRLLTATGVDFNVMPNVFFRCKIDKGNVNNTPTILFSFILIKVIFFLMDVFKRTAKLYFSLMKSFHFTRAFQQHIGHSASFQRFTWNYLDSQIRNHNY